MSTAKIQKALFDLGDIARETAMKYFRHKLEVEHKSAEQPVTIADRSIEEQMRSYLHVNFPKDGILGEEFGHDQGSSGRRWVLDPIDGTKAFITAMPTFVSLVALHDQEQGVIAALIEVPAMNERFYALKGQGAFWQRPDQGQAKRIEVNAHKPLAHSLLGLTSPDNFQGEYAQKLELVHQNSLGRRFGGDGYLFGLLAAGFFDVIIESPLQPYDYLAPSLLVSEAGGFINDWQGRPLGLKADCPVLATASRQQMDELLVLVQS